MSAAQTIMLKYGPPDAAYFAQNCIIWEAASDYPWLGNVLNKGTGRGLKRIYINKEFKSRLAAAFSNLERANLHTLIKTFDGCYNPRNVRGRDSKSLHAWAMAIDLNADMEKLGQQSTQWPAQFIAIMKAAGIFWGGDWINRKDSMHFALFNG